MNVRQTERGLARFTLGGLALYVPLETLASWPRLWDPFYLVDLIGMLLLATGAVRALRADAGRTAGVLCAGYAWTAANFWRAFWSRVNNVSSGGALAYGTPELWIVGVATCLAVACLALSLVIVTRAEYATNPVNRPRDTPV